MQDKALVKTEGDTLEVLKAYTVFHTLIKVADKALAYTKAHVLARVKAKSLIDPLKRY